MWQFQNQPWSNVMCCSRAQALDASLHEAEIVREKAAHALEVSQKVLRAVKDVVRACPMWLVRHEDTTLLSKLSRGVGFNC